MLRVPGGFEQGEALGSRLYLAQLTFCEVCEGDGFGHLSQSLAGFSPVLMHGARGLIAALREAEYAPVEVFGPLGRVEDLDELDLFEGTNDPEAAVLSTHSFNDLSFSEPAHQARQELVG